MEVMLLSVLSPIVTCDWHLEDWEEATISSVSCTCVCAVILQVAKILQMQVETITGINT